MVQASLHRDSEGLFEPPEVAWGRIVSLESFVVIVVPQEDFCVKAGGTAEHFRWDCPHLEAVGIGPRDIERLKIGPQQGQPARFGFQSRAGGIRGDAGG